MEAIDRRTILGTGALALAGAAAQSQPATQAQPLSHSQQGRPFARPAHFDTRSLQQMQLR